MQPDDKLIITLCRQNDPRAADLLIRKYGRALYAFVFRLTRSHDLADEILQDTLVKAFHAAADLPRDANLKSWLFKAAYNRCLDLLKSETRRKSREASYHEEHALIKETGNPVEKEVFKRELAADIKTAMDALPPRQKTALCLFAVENFSVKQIADIMQCSQGTASTHINRAREALRQTLRPSGPAQDDLLEDF